MNCYIGLTILLANLIYQVGADKIEDLQLDVAKLQTSMDLYEIQLLELNSRIDNQTEQITDLEEQLDKFQQKFELQMTKLIKELKNDHDNDHDKDYDNDHDNGHKRGSRNHKHYNCERDWISYSNKKCFKVLEEKGTESEGKEMCRELDRSSTLITIESKEEHKFLTNHLEDYNSISDNVWIGLKYSRKSFKWTDGTELKFENWGENAHRDGKHKCVQMSITEDYLGKWTDDNCKKKYLIVCQKKHSKDKETEEEINIKMIETLRKEINSLIPLGYLYTQFPDQCSPLELWPNMTWDDVTNDYAGLFFRAEGGGSQSFGEVQDAQQSGISKVYARGYQELSIFDGLKKFYYQEKQLRSGSWNVLAPGYAIDRIHFFKTEGDIRPRNTAIKIWKRIE